MRTGAFFFLSLLSLACCVILGFVVSWNLMFFFDAQVERIILELRDPVLTKTMLGMSLFAGAYASGLIALCVSFVLMRHKHIFLAYLYVCAVVLGGVVNIFLKSLLQIERPVTQLVDIFGWSYPSGHTTLATITFSLIAYFVFRSPIIKRTWIKVCVAVVALALVLAVAASRVYLGAHFTSDIIGGVYLGVAVVFLVIGVERFVVAHRKM